MPDMTAQKGLPELPMDEEGPVFREPWEAQAFALVLKLYQGGHFAWPEWVEYLSGEIRKAQNEGGPAVGDRYYRHWLAALEKLALAKGFMDSDELALRQAQIAANIPDRHQHVAKRDPVRIA